LGFFDVSSDAIKGVGVGLALAGAFWFLRKKGVIRI